MVKVEAVGVKVGTKSLLEGLKGFTVGVMRASEALG